MAQPSPKKAKLAASGPQISILQFFFASLLFQFFLSYVITETWTWGYKSKWMYAQNWKYLLVIFPQPSCSLTQTRPLNLTESELARYDGSDPTKPIYLAIECVAIWVTLRFSGDVYDVSANRRLYGPGGGYGFFAGKDAARAFVTGCFKEDLTHDVRGLDPSQLEARLSFSDNFS